MTLFQNFGTKTKLSFTLYNSDDPIPENIRKGNLFNPRKGQIMFPGWFCQSRAAAWDDFLEKTIWTNAKQIHFFTIYNLQLIA